MVLGPLASRSSASDLGDLKISSSGSLQGLSIRDLRSYANLEARFGPGPQLIVGPNAAGKTSLLEAIVLLAWGRSHRTSSDGELVRWGSELGRVEGQAGSETIEVALVRPAGVVGARKRIRVNGVPRRATGLMGLLRTVVFAPEEMLLVVGSPGLRRAALDQLATQRSAAYGRDLATYGRTLQQRNSLLRAIREEQAGRDELRFWDASFLDAGGAIVAERLRLLEDLAGPLARAHAEIAPDEAGATRLAIAYATNAPAFPGESPRDALARRLAETADKEIWNGSTLVGPHRDDLVFTLDGRDMSGFASRGQQRTAILAFKLAELDLLTEQDGRPPLLLLDDVFSELDPDRRSHLVRRIAALPQAFVTTTTLDDLDPALVTAATAWEVVPDGGAGAALRSIETPGNGPARRPGTEPDALPVLHPAEP
jgi:DNA replication and repair protein RecF